MEASTAGAGTRSRRTNVSPAADGDNRRLLDALADPAAWYDADGLCLHANAAFVRLVQEADGQSGFAAALREHVRLALANGVNRHGVARGGPVGEAEAWELRFVPVGGSGTRTVLVTGRDLAALREAERRMEQVEAIARLGCWRWDAATRRVLPSPGTCRIFGRPSHWRPTLNEVLAAVDDGDRDWLRIALSVAVADRAPEATFDYCVEVEGRPVHLHSSARIEYESDGRVARAVGTVQDVSELKGYQQRLQSLAFYDPLTGLANRQLFTERLQKAIQDAAEESHEVGVLVMDLDNFKEINETLGHRAGDEVLRETAVRLLGCVRDSDTVAHLGGDEFGIVLPAMRPDADIRRVCDEMLAAVGDAFSPQGTEVFLTGSIGVARYPHDGTCLADLLQHADASMYHAKGAGRNTYEFYSERMTALVTERLALAGRLHRAEANGEFELYYQPQIDLLTGELIGAEALLRWNHPDKGLVMPDRFVGIAEDTGLIVGIGEWVFRTACMTAVRWNRGGSRPLRVAVNVSVRQFRSRSLVGSFRRILEETGCEPPWVEVEITESVLLDHAADIIRTLTEFDELGLSISIDDFGTGYSSLGYLTRLPAKALKIDRSFVSAIVERREAAELVKAIIAMARSLGLQVVAEGIENRDQERFLKLHGCDCGQGYLYGKPMPRQAFEAAMSCFGMRAEAAGLS